MSTEFWKRNSERGGIRVHHGKTQNVEQVRVHPKGSGRDDQNGQEDCQGCRSVEGDQNLPVGQQGIQVLGVPIGQEEYIKEPFGQEV